VKNADLVITGEGAADRQTLMGKLPMGILQQSGSAPVCLIAGRISNLPELLKAGFRYIECINPDGISIEEALRKDTAKHHITTTVKQVINEELLK
jgi:glycerate kinase